MSNAERECRRLRREAGVSEARADFYFSSSRLTPFT